MAFLRFRRGAGARKVVSGAIALLSLFFVFYQASILAFAQEEATTGTEPPPAQEPVVSAEAKASAEAALTVSPEAAKEQSVDLKAELNLQDYDPIVPDSFGNKILYPLKNFAWDTQEFAYDVFASESTHADLVADHADKELVAAAKLYSEDPKASGEILGILTEYEDDLETVKDAIPQVKAEDPTFAKSLSAEIAENHGFVAPKVLGSIVDATLAAASADAPQLLEIKKDVAASAVGGIVAAADNESEITEALKTIATQRQSTPFSGIANAEILSTAKEQLAGASQTIQGALDQVISFQLKSVEENLKSLPSSDKVKADSFEKYVAQLPGHSVERMKIMDQFKSQADLPPILLEKCQEIKAKVAEAIGAKIQNLVQEEIRKAVSAAILEVKNPGVDDFKVLTEIKDLIPDEQVKKEIAARHEESVQKFLNRFGDDKNAQAVTAEFQALTQKVQSGAVAPDANFFKTLGELKNRLSPQQQTFIDDMSKTGRQEMLDRFQHDQHFAERFSTFNPADAEIYKQVGEGSFGGVNFGPEVGAPASFNFTVKFQQIEQQQAENFNHYLEFQNRPEDVQAIRQQFETAIPEEVRQRFETQYHFDDAAFSKHEEFAKEKQEFFQQKFQEIQKQYEEKFGPQGQGGQGQGSQGAPGQTGQFPGGIPTPFPGTPGFGFPGIGAPGFGPGFPPPFTGGGQGGNVGSPPPGYLGPPVDTTTGCPAGMVKGQFGCEFQFEKPQIQTTSCPPEMVATPFGCEPPRISPTYPTPTGTTYPTPSHDPAADCAAHGGTWTGSFCKFGAETTTYPSPTGTTYPSPTGTTYPSPTGTTYPTPTADPAADCAAHGGTWTGSFCKFGTETTTYPTPTSTTYPTPSTSTTYPTPSTSTTYPSPTGTTYPTPSTSTTYPTPSTSTTYPTPSTSTTYPTPSTSTTYPYPTPSTSTTYPTPSTSTTYPTPSTTYPTPAYAYPTPAETYPTPAYAYPTPSYAYPTPSYPYPTPHAYNYPLQLSPGPQVAGAFSEAPRQNWGPFDLLALVGLGVYGYRKRSRLEIE